MDILKQLSLAGLVPVIKVDDAADAVPLCRALCEGGLPVAEITFRTAAAEQAIKNVHEQLPDMLLGAGTVLTCEQVDRAVAAGAAFIVSPGLNPDVVRHCVSIGVPITPGCANPSDIEVALSLGLKTVKFFPAEALGGLKLIKAISAPYGGVTFIPTGGINPQNLKEYLAFPKILACGGSWMVPDDAVKAKDWARIAALASEAVATMLGFELLHIGVNTGDMAQGEAVASGFGKLLGWPTRTTSKGYFTGKQIEIMGGKGPGTHGHIAIGVTSVDRARWHLERRGYAFDESSARYDAAGKCTFVYLKDEIGGFAVHLIGK